MDRVETLCVYASAALAERPKATLIIRDDADVLTAVREVFERCGWVVDVAMDVRSIANGISIVAPKEPL